MSARALLVAGVATSRIAHIPVECPVSYCERRAKETGRRYFLTTDYHAVWFNPDNVKAYADCDAPVLAIVDKHGHWVTP